MATERLVLPLKQGHPVGYQLERLMLDYLAEEEDGWTVVTGSYTTHPRESTPLSRSFGSMRLSSDVDGAIVGSDLPFFAMGSYEMYRVRFDAGPVVAMFPMDDADDVESGTVVGCAEGFVNVLVWEHGCLAIKSLVSDTLDGWLHSEKLSEYRHGLDFMQYFHVHARDDYVLK